MTLLPEFVSFFIYKIIDILLLIIWHKFFLYFACYYCKIEVLILLLHEIIWICPSFALGVGAIFLRNLFSIDVWINWAMKYIKDVPTMVSLKMS